MTALRDPFDNVLKREGKFDYVPWSSIADRLDEAEGTDGWSFAIIGIGPDWVHGRLTIGDRHFENIGYAENATADWAKEVLKHAATDAFKRCAALAGVARYLYDKEAGFNGAPVRPQALQAAPQKPVAVPTADADPYADLPWDDSEVVPFTGKTPEFPPFAGIAPNVGDECPLHPGEKWRGNPGDLYHGPKGVVPDGYCRPAGQPKKARAR